MCAWKEWIMFARVQNDRKSRSGYKRHATGVGGTLGDFQVWPDES